jgi:hypothetical protein
MAALSVVLASTNQGIKNGGESLLNIMVDEKAIELGSMV